MKILQPTKPVIEGNFLAKNKAVKMLIDNEQVKEYEDNLRFPRGIIVIWILALIILITGIYLITKI